MIPEEMLPHVVTVVTPAAVVDEYGDEVDEFDADRAGYGYPVETREIRAWLQQTIRNETDDTVGNRLVGQWLMVTNAEGVTGRDRIQWDGLVFTVEGPPTPAWTPAGHHHAEITLRRVEG